MKKSTKRAIGALVLLAILAWQYATPREPAAKPGTVLELQMRH